MWTAGPPKRKGAGGPHPRRLRPLAWPAPKFHSFSEGTPVRRDGYYPPGGPVWLRLCCEKKVIRRRVRERPSCNVVGKMRIPRNQNRGLVRDEGRPVTETQ